MKAILMSIQSKHLVNILNDKKTIELRKKFPSDFRGWVYCYCTKTKPYITQQSKSQFTIRESKDFTNLINGKVVCRFWVENVEEITYEQLLITTANSGWAFNEYLTYTLREKELLQKSCLEAKELYNYLYNTKSGKAISISKLEIFYKPKELGEFSIFKRETISCGMDCPPYTDWVEYRVYKAPQSWQYIYIEEDK